MDRKILWNKYSAVKIFGVFLLNVNLYYHFPVIRITLLIKRHKWSYIAESEKEN